MLTVVRYTVSGIFFRYIAIHGLAEDSAVYDSFMEELCDIKLASNPKAKTLSLIDLIQHFQPPLDLPQQFQFLSNTSNSHYNRYILAKRKMAAKRNASIRLHLLYNPNNTDTNNSV